MSNLYLTATAADAGVTAGSGTKWATALAPGAASTHLNKESVAGPTAPLQMTDGAAGTDGTAVSWYTPPLRGVTIAGAISCFFWTRENATANNVAPSMRIERCDGSGNVLSTIVDETVSHGASEMGTTAGGSSDALTASAGNVTDTTLSDGDRLRITLWIDDAAGQGGTGSMASGGRGEFWVNGPDGAAGQSRLGFTEIIQPLDGPHIVQIVEASWTGTSSPLSAVLSAAQDGDTVLVLAGGDGGNTGNEVTASTISTSAGSTGGWTDVEKQINSGSTGWLHSAKTTVSSTGSVTAQVARTQTGTARAWGMVAILIRDSAGIGTDVFGNTSATETVSLTVAAKSAVFFMSVDWDALTPATGYTPAGASDIERATQNTAYTLVCGYWLGQAAGTRAYGTNNTSSSTNLRCLGVEVLAPAGGQSATVNQATETDTATALGEGKLKAIGQALSTATAGVVTPGKRRTLAQALEAATATAVGERKLRAAGQALETDGGGVVTPVSTGGPTALNAASEADTATTPTETKRKAVAPAVSADTGTPVTERKAKAVQAATELDAATAVGEAKRRTVNQAATIATATAVGERKLRAVAQAAELDTGGSIQRPGQVGKAFEADTATALTERKTRTVGQAAETDTGGGLIRRIKTAAVGRATELATAAALFRRKLKPVPQATETATATVLAEQKRRPLGQATETDAAATIGGGGLVAILGAATETDTATPIAYRLVTPRPGGPVTAVPNTGVTPRPAGATTPAP